MAEEIINRVAESKLVTFNLEDYYLPGKRVLFDISEWLLEGFILKEKEFRARAAEHEDVLHGRSAHGRSRLSSGAPVGLGPMAGPRRALSEPTCPVIRAE